MKTTALHSVLCCSVIKFEKHYWGRWKISARSLDLALSYTQRYTRPVRHEGRLFCRGPGIQASVTKSYPKLEALNPKSKIQTP